MPKINYWYLVKSLKINDFSFIWVDHKVYTLKNKRNLNSISSKRDTTLEFNTFEILSFKMKLKILRKSHTGRPSKSSIPEMSLSEVLLYTHLLQIEPGISQSGILDFLQIFLELDSCTLSFCRYYFPIFLLNLKHTWRLPFNH